VAYTYNGISFNLKKEEYCAIRYNMDETWGHDAKWKSQLQKTNTVWFYSQEVLREVKIIIKTESSSGSCQGLGEEENGDLLFIAYRVYFTRWKKFWGCGDVHSPQCECTMWPLNNMALNCTDPLKCGFFSINTI